MQITTEQIKELRDATGVSVMQCKKALEEAGGNMEKALMVLKKKSTEIASKKSDREAKDGLVVIKTGKGKVVLTVLNCETDFVAKNSDFINLANQIADMALAEGADSAKAKAQDMISPVVQKIGENIQFNKILTLEGENIGSYVHNGKAGVAVSLVGGTPELAREVAMHIAAMKPEYGTKEEIPADMVSSVKELFIKEVDATGKPQEMKDKIMQGKIDAYFKERTLLEQPFIKNPDTTVGKLLEQNKATLKGFIHSTLA
jgi:elongation factor Ts